MNELIKMVIEYQSVKNEYYLKKIFLRLEKIINKKLGKVSIYYKEDLYREIENNIYLIIIKFKINYFQNINIFILNNYKLISRNKYLIKFININKEDIYKLILLDVEYKQIFLNEYNLYCNENQFLNIVKKRIESIYNNYLKTQYNEKITIASYYENLFIKEYKREYSLEEKLYLYGLKEEEINLLTKFIDKGELLTQAQVAEKLRISQQAVNKRLLKIIKKYNNSSQIK